MNHHSDIYRALIVNPGTGIVHDAQRIYAEAIAVSLGGIRGGPLRTTVRRRSGGRAFRSGTI